MSSSEVCGTVAICNRNIDGSAYQNAQQNAAVDLTAQAVNAVSQLLRRASTVDNLRRSQSKCRIKADNMTKAIPLISPEEYEKLPLSIQRKYFSPEERLQIAQCSAAEKRQRQPPRNSDAMAQPTPSLTSPVSCEFSKRRKTIKKANSKKQLQLRRSSLPLAFSEDTVQAKATWLSALPEKAQRAQLDHRERIALSRPEPLERPRTSSNHKPILNNFHWDKNRSASAETPRMAHSPCTTPSLHSPTPSEATSQSRESHASSRAQHSRQPLAPALTRPKARSPEQDRLAARRNFLLQPIPLPPPVLAPSTSLPSPDTYEHIGANHFDSIIVRMDNSVSDADITPTQELDSGQDITSSDPAPSWYDEKLDFGFDARKPSTSTDDPWEHPRAMSMSISDTASSHGPMTPISPAPHSFEIKAEQPLSLQQIVEQTSNVTNFSHLKSRRSDDDVKSRRNEPKHLVDGFYAGQHPNQPYSVTVHYDNHDPLALETLPVCDDPSGAHGAFAVHPEHSATGFRKVLKVIRGQ